MNERLGRQIFVGGIVQGVGFRPFVYTLAQRFGLNGWVRNTSAGVEISIEGENANLDAFEQALQTELPPLARLDTFDSNPIPPWGAQVFEILHSEGQPGAFQPISADVFTCPACLAELFDPADRRYRYPFINCTHCGPRFTIIQDIPYDRPNTTMAEFTLCPDCAREYADPLDRRFHAQPVACPACGPHTWLEVDGKTLAEGESAIQATRQMLAEGKILAIKGLGGFHLACDAANQAAVAELRRRKLRVDKPFALMASDPESAARWCLLSPEEERLLTSRERPVVVLRRKPLPPGTNQPAPAVAPFQDTLGVMLPYTPLHALLLEKAPGYPELLVMTSGNLSEEPIVTDNQAARERLAGLADAFLLHNRAIHTRCDDSVVQAWVNPPKEYTGVNFLRRARGYAPNPLHLPWKLPPILGVGAELKNTFCLARDHYAFLSHHIGDLENFETLQAFEQGTAHFERLFRIQPEALAYDLHPNYLATRYALERAENQGLPALGVQHHHAHIAACMAENGVPPEETVIGLSFDGTGYGTDGAIWGGEVILATYAGFERLFHLNYVPLLGGDKAVREPWRVALAWLAQANIAWDADLPPAAFAPQSAAAQGLRTPSSVLSILRHQLNFGVNAPITSSMGRLFDAAASLAGLRHTTNYEAQAAIEFERAADPAETGSYPYQVANGLFDAVPLVRALVREQRKGVGIPTLSARFHNSIARMGLDACLAARDQTGAARVALSGGVWQNTWLLSQSVRLLEAAGFEVLLHRSAPANDGGLALGQVMIGYFKLYS